jgi:hypothetical protein
MRKANSGHVVKTWREDLGRNIFAAFTFCSLQGAAAEPSPLAAEQRVELKKGWNAVHLTVEPSAPDVEKVFEDTPVDRVACLLRPVTSSQFIRDPAEEPWRKDTWRVWYAPDTEEAVLSSLHSIHANQAYLVHSKAATQMVVRGEVEVVETRWVADAFNLTGFAVDPASPPTFAQYFSGSQAHRGLKIYRLQGDRWSKVSNPLSTPMRRGEACWVYTDGASGYQGPVRLRMRHSSGILFGKAGDRVRLEIANHGLDPAEVVLSGLGAVPLSVRYTVLTDSGVETVHVPVGDRLMLPVLEPGRAVGVDLELRTDGSSPSGTGGGAGVMELRSDTGVLQKVPVVALTR